MLLAEDGGGAVLHELVGPADAGDRGGNAGGGEVFHHGAAEAVHEDVVFERADDLDLRGEGLDAGGVERLDPAGIDESDAEALGFQLLLGDFGDFHHRTEGDEGDIGAVGEDLGLADLHEHGLVLGLHAGAAAARVADGDGALVVVHHGPEHVDELVFVLGLHVDDAGDAAQVGDVEQTVVRGAVVAAEAAAVHAQAHGQVLDRHVMDDHVDRPLHEGRIDGEEGAQALGGHAAGEQGGVLFGDADIVVALRQLLLEDAEAGAAGHGGGDGDDLGIGLGEIDHAAGVDLRVGGGGGACDLAGLDVVLAEAVELARIFERGFVATALLRDDVQEHGLVAVLEELEGLDQQRQIVAVNRAVVTHAEFLKDHRGGGRWLLGGGKDEALGALFHLAGEATDDLAAELLDELRRLQMQGGVGRMGGHVVEVLRDGAHVAVDGPLVVVEHDDELLGVAGDVVERLERGAAGEGGIAGDADDVFVAALQITGGGHAERGGEGGASVAGTIAIVLALGAQREAVEAFILADGVDAVPAAGEHLVHVGLMCHVPDELVGGGVEHPVHGERELHHAEIGAQMAAGLAQGFDQGTPNLLREGGQLIQGQAFHVGWRMDVWQGGCARRVGCLRHRRWWACGVRPAERRHAAWERFRSGSGKVRQPRQRLDRTW